MIVLFMIKLKLSVFRFIKLVDIFVFIMLVIVINIVSGIIVVVIKVVWKLFNKRNSIMIISSVFFMRFLDMVVMVLLISVVWL